MVNHKNKMNEEPHTPRIGLRRKPTVTSYYSILNSPTFDYECQKTQIQNRSKFNKNTTKNSSKTIIKKEPINYDYEDSETETPDSSLSSTVTKTTSSVFKLPNQGGHSPETYLIDRYKYAVLHIKQGLSVEEACNKYRISKGALLKCLSGGTAPRGKKTRLTESEENEIVDWLINYKDLKYNDAIHLVFEQVAQKFELAQRPNPFNNGKPSMDWWYDFLSRHPQIMASKPDWIMRGKVNDQYIKDVQSGHLKCTKFRRALLSAIQYIRSLKETLNSSDEFFFNHTEADNFVNKENSIMKTQENSQVTLSSLKNEPFTNDSRLKRPRISQNKSRHSKGFLCKKVEDDDRAEKVNIESHDDNETNIDNATFITEIFNSELELELESNNFDDLIDRNFLIDNQFKDEDYDSSIYDMNSLDYMLNNNFRIESTDSNQQTNDFINTNEFKDSFRLNLKDNNQHTHYQHLLVPDDDEDE